MTPMQLGDPVTHRRHTSWTGAVARSPLLDGSKSFYGKPFLRAPQSGDDTEEAKVGQEEMDTETIQVYVEWTRQDTEDPDGAREGGRWYILSAIKPRNTSYKVEMTLNVAIVVPGLNEVDAKGLAKEIVVDGLNQIEGVWAGASGPMQAYLAQHDSVLPDKD